MTDTKMRLARWLAVAAGGDTVRLVPVRWPSTGPDVFCKLIDAEVLIAAERERCAKICEAARPAGGRSGFSAGLDAMKSKLQEAIDSAPPLPQCKHGRSLCDWSGELLDLQCGCQIEMQPDETINWWARIKLGQQ